ncbi:hypothetical protein MBLNU457_4005t1 [Dothideomycetes sp. NU457]
MSASVADSTTNPVHSYRNVIKQYHLTQMQATGVEVNACNDKYHKAATTFSPSRSVLPKSQRSARPPRSAAPTSELSNNSSMSEGRWDAAMESAMTSPTVSRTHSQKSPSPAAISSLRSTPRHPRSRGEWNHSYTVTPEEMVRESIFAGRAAVEEVMRRLSIEQDQQTSSVSDESLDEGISMTTKQQSGIKIIISSEPLHPELVFNQTKPNRARGHSQGHDQVATPAIDAVNRLDVGMRLKSEVDLRLLEEMNDEEQGTPSNTPAPAPGKGMLRANTVAATRGGKRLGRSLAAPLKAGTLAAECF